MGQLEDIALFVRIVDSGGISKAAEQLSMAKSAVSRRLAELESKYNSQLLNRTTRKWNLTQSGEVLYRRAKGIIDDVTSLQHELSDANISLEGTLKISIPLSLGLAHLTGMLTEFARLHPGLMLEIDLTDRKVDLIEEGYTMAIRVSDLADSSLKARRISEINHVLVASPDFVDRNGEFDQINNLSELPFLRYNRRDKATLDLINANGEKIAVKVKGNIASNNGDLLRKFALEGQGITSLPTFIVYKDIEQGKLLPLFQDYKIPSSSVYAVYPNSRFLPVSARYLIDYLVEHCGGDIPFWDTSI